MLRRTWETWGALFPSKIPSQCSLAAEQAMKAHSEHNLPGIVRILASHFFSRSSQVKHLAEAVEVTPGHEPLERPCSLPPETTFDLVSEGSWEGRGPSNH